LKYKYKKNIMADVNIFSNGIALEGRDATLTFTIELSAPVTVATTYYATTFSNTAISGVDFTALNNFPIPTFAVGERVKTISITITNDSFVEADETFFVNLYNSNLPTQTLLATTFGTITDVFTSDVTTTLSTNVESLTLTGTGNINGTGNANANNIIGNSGNNTLDGGSGNDTVNGGAGSDSLIGGAGDDTLIGSTGVDTLLGGTGNDIYVIDASDKILGETDGGGSDTIEISTNYDLSVLGTGSFIENLTLTGTTAITGKGNGDGNIIKGNIKDNNLDGKDGSDNLQGEAGKDTLIGGFGDDTLNGGSGIDSLVGNDGNDTYVIDSASDKIVEGANQGVDTVEVAYGNYTIANQGNLENITLTGLLKINATGNTGNNKLVGNNRNNILDGGVGNDTLDGNGGVDTLKGGVGNDFYILDNNGDVVDVVLETATGGLDTVISNSDYTLAANLENLQLSGNGDFSAIGNALGNNIFGNAGENVLDGRGGDDLLIGGLGDDTYYVDSPNDIVREDIADSAGDVIVINFDTVTFYEINDTGDKRFINHLTLAGLASKAKGNSMGNILLGNEGSDTLDGGAGFDTLDGGEGQDILIGGTGGDLYRINLSLVANEQDQIQENPSSDIDTIEASYFGTTPIETSISENVEIFKFLGTANLNVIGNGTNNIITTTIGNDTLSGGDGNDSLNSSDGNDRLSGGLGNDTLDGSIGVDTLIGGSGDDLFLTDSFYETLTETANQGTDTVQSTVSYTLKTNFENLILSGFTNINGTGNSVNNIILGNSGSNTLDGQLGDDVLNGGTGNDVLLGQEGNDFLDGGFGNDTLYGSVGNDTYVVDAIGDVIIEGFNEGTTDLATTSIDYTLTDNVENLTLYVGNPPTIPTTNINGTGNALNNLITGSFGSNIIDGGLGNDVMIGLRGNDIYYINAIGDTITEKSFLEDSFGGIDTAFISLNNDTLDGNVENLTLIGTAVKGTGNSLDNRLIGNSLANNLIALDGNDFLEGLGGNDTLVGGNGNDTYIINNTGVTITETTGQGTDLVISSITYTLPASANVENLQLSGVANINGTGNSLDNNIAGNSGNNVLSGSIGNDTLIGNEGNDTLTGDQGNDILTGSSGADFFNYKTNRAYNGADIGSDTILDFSRTQGDKLIVGKTTFGLASVVGNSFSVVSEFASVTLESLVDVSSAKIVHSQQTGNLYFNANGATPLGTSLIVDTNVISALSGTDFIIA
jgi:Ca2+-binding RTX toxin-like protein